MFVLSCWFSYVLFCICWFHAIEKLFVIEPPYSGITYNNNSNERLRNVQFIRSARFRHIKIPHFWWTTILNVQDIEILKFQNVFNSQYGLWRLRDTESNCDTVRIRGSGPKSVQFADPKNWAICGCVYDFPYK